METMLAAVFKGEGKLLLEEKPVPEVKKDHDVKIAVKGVGICGTDLHILEVPPRHPASFDVIMGHEFCGEVTEVGQAVTNCQPGDHVAIDQNAAVGIAMSVEGFFPEPIVEIEGLHNVDVVINKIDGKLAINLVNTSGPHDG